MNEIMEKILRLEAAIIKHKALYYQGRPEITDAEYDQIEDELKKLDPNNPTLNIVGTSELSSEKMKHEKKMLSLEKTYSTEELLKWKGDEDILSTHKLDGVSCSLVYVGGELAYAKTRGDGVFGEKITEKVVWISELPKNISIKDKIEVRGELYCDEGQFYKLSQEMLQLGLERPTSQRNIVAGLIGRKDHLELCRYLRFMAFDYIFHKNVFNKESEKFVGLKNLGFQVPCYVVCNSNEFVLEAISSAQKFMNEGEYQIDGIVFTYDNIKLHDELGETSHHPRYKIAFKFQGESKKTKINEIIWSVSRNGILTPVAEVEPVEVSGAKIGRVTLHNFGVVAANQLKVGDEIEIIRSGEVIPKFLSVVKDGGGKFEIPRTCPSCESEVVIKDIRIFCTNQNCPGRNLELILNFVQKVGIEDLSLKRLEELAKKGLINKISDLYRLKREDFLKMEKVKEKLAEKFIKSIENSKNVDLVTFMAALGLTGGAYNKCEKIIHAGFNTIEKLMNMTEKDLVCVDSFAEKSAKDLIESLADKKSLINELIVLGFQFRNSMNIKQTKITGKRICITGALTEKRSVVEDLIRRSGGIVVSSVSKNTDLLVTNENDPTSTKYKKAVELKIETITEGDLYTLVAE